MLKCAIRWEHRDCAKCADEDVPCLRIRGMWLCRFCAAPTLDAEAEGAHEARREERREEDDRE